MPATDYQVIQSKGQSLFFVRHCNVQCCIESTNKILRELNQSAWSMPKSHPRKFLKFEKVPPCKQGLSEGLFLP